MPEYTREMKRISGKPLVMFKVLYPKAGKMRGFVLERKKRIYSDRVPVA